MDKETKTRLRGLRDFLSDLFKCDISISGILIDYGFDQAQVDEIRTEHINQFAAQVSYQIYVCVAEKWSIEFAEVIEFWYCLDGRISKEEQKDKNSLNGFDAYLSQLHDNILQSLSKPVKREFIFDIIVSSAQDILLSDRSNLLKQVKKEYSKGLIKQSVERVKNQESTPHAVEKVKEQESKPHKSKKSDGDRVPSRVIVNHQPTRVMVNPWLGLSRHKSNWW